mmetsp:Transcript_22868/g.39172  ORF Transcript_22868/g.39172 Transcript_22868/m.39172 type:complete len:155 (-) Transcript_22868:498-962(-)
MLRQHGITHVLSLMSGSSLSVKLPGSIQHKFISIRDDIDENIGQYFEDCFEFIDQGRRAGGVLIHCLAGRSRSATICIAYLMRMSSLSYEQALQKVQVARPLVAPNIGFVEQLREFQKGSCHNLRSAPRTPTSPAFVPPPPPPPPPSSAIHPAS